MLGASRCVLRMKLFLKYKIPELADTDDQQIFSSMRDHGCHFYLFSTRACLKRIF